MQGSRNGLRVYVPVHEHMKIAVTSARKRQCHRRALVLLSTKADSSYALMSAHHANVTSRWGLLAQNVLAGRQGSLVHLRGCWLTFRAWAWDAFSFLHPVCCVAFPALTVFWTCLLHSNRASATASVIPSCGSLTSGLHSSFLPHS